MEEGNMSGINSRLHRYPYSIVWTPIPVLTWLFPVIGHMGICTSGGIIRDFAGPYYVSEDNMAFGNPTRYAKLDPGLVEGVDWDTAIADAAGLYKTRMHNLCCDNCHSMVANALNRMKYKGSQSWNMFYVAVIVFFSGNYIGLSGALKSLLPSIVLYAALVTLIIYLNLSYPSLN
uniref:Unkown protein n=1 Tax=Riptortus pedestris TaxID=329032 RepID=R4WDS0_RIPPE|nr:unkown protein [Riptortus pedestris]